MDTQESESKSEEDSNYGPQVSGLWPRLCDAWKQFVEEFRKIGNNDSAAQTGRAITFTHVAIMRRLNHPES